MDLFNLRNEFSKSGIMMCFNGPFSHSIIEETGKAMRNHLASENIVQTAVLDVFAVYIELAQNVRNYLALREITSPEATSSIIAIAKRGDQYAVSSGNMVLSVDGEKLCARIDEINGMSADEIKQQYRQQMRADVPPGALGAGLGFLEIAKRSSGKMERSVSKINDSYDFFSLTALI